MNMTCCLNATSPVTWYTSITDKKTTLESSGLPNATDVTFNDTCQVYTFIATLAINGTRISCLYGNVPSINVTVLVTTGCESMKHVYTGIKIQMFCLMATNFVSLTSSP